MIYFATPYHAIPEKWRHKFGVMCSLAGRIEYEGLNDCRPWMLDNGIFANKFGLDRWLSVMDRLSEYKDTCKGIVVPDEVGNAERTRELWDEYKDYVPDYYPKCFVGQDGLTDDLIPWDEFEVFFVGGTDEFKLKDSWPFINQARERSKWVHVGRVNTAKRIKIFWEVDSLDGTAMNKWRKYRASPRESSRFEIIHHALNYVNGKKLTRRLL